MSRHKLYRHPRRRPTVVLAMLACLAIGSSPPARAQTPANAAQGAAPQAARAAAEARPGDDGKSDWREILPGLTMGSQLRLRAEARDNFKFDESRAGNDEAFLLSRFRWDLSWEPAEHVTAVVELQDARIYGERAIDENRAPNIFADELDVHRAFFDLRAPASAGIPVSFRAGRQKLSYGAQRLVSPLEWVNTARVFDGAKVVVGTGTGRTLDAFATRPVPVAPRHLNRHDPTGSRLFNSQFHGIYYTDGNLFADSVVEAYWLLRREGRLGDAVHSVGGRFDGAFGPWTLDVEAARQTGTFGDADHRAAMVHAGAAFATGWPGRPKLSAAVNLGQGDDDPGDGVHRTFDNLYPLNHAFYGYMDFFALQNLRNVEVAVDAALPRRAGLRVVYQHFALLEPGTDAWYNAGAGRVHQAPDPTVSSNVGSEIDVVVTLPLPPVGLEAGYGRFFGGPYLTETGIGSGAADFFYLQTLVGF